MANLGYILKQSVMDATANAQLSDLQFRQLITGLFFYATKGEECFFRDAPLDAIFALEKPSIDANNKKWEKRRREFFNNDENLSF